MKEDRYLSIMDLPTEILAVILSGLPIRTLLACRSVSKTLLNLISDPVFAKLYPENCPVEVLLQNFGRDDVKLPFYLTEVEGDRTARRRAYNRRVTKLTTKFYIPEIDGIDEFRLKIVNSCNGLLYFSQSVAFVFYGEPCLIYNPITGEYMTVPQSERCSDFGPHVESGLGFCRKSNQYKVVRMTYRPKKIKGCALFAESYTLGAASWRPVGWVPHMPGSADVVYMNGVIHWDCGWDNYHREVVLSFDCEKEEFGVVPPPLLDDDQGQPRGSLLGVLEGCLCYSFNYSYFKDVEIWVMKDYGVQESWTLEYAITLQEFTICKPLKYLNNGDLLLSYGKALVIYWHDKEGYKYLEGPEDAYAIVHTPSLVSLRDAIVGDNVQVHDISIRITMQS